jgi:hypothetical protein
MGVDFAALKERSRQEREAQERARAYNPETPPASRWGDYGHELFERKAPWLRGWVKISIALVSVLAIFVLLVYVALWCL